MERHRFLPAAALATIITTANGAEPLPPGVRAQWDTTKAWRETTLTRERICINGLWRFQPAEDAAAALPGDVWGYFKVPGSWPGITDYMQKDCQTVFAHERWKNARLGELTAAWYEREIAVPASWSGRRIALCAEYVNSYAAVYVDEKKAGEIRFPAGELDLTQFCRPGAAQRLSLLVIAVPLKEIMASFGDSAAPKVVRGSVKRRGLCGDVYLTSAPAGPRIGGVRVGTSVAGGTISVDAELAGLNADAEYILNARVLDGERTLREFACPPFRGDRLKEGRLLFSENWKPEKLWDLHTPGNQYDLTVELLDAARTPLDVAYRTRFGAREFTVKGRDFFLNGSRVYLSALPLDNAEIGAAWASYEGAKESLLRLKSFGINFVYTHNYGCEPGTHLSFEEVLRAADDTGVLVALSQPHFGQYDWKAPDADRANGYARHAESYTRVAGNHPSVVFYAMSHNATGYSDDMNPDMIDGVSDPRESWARNNAKLALRAEAIVARLDPGRTVYHHSSGNLGSMHTSNFYTNFAPAQELDEWFGPWAEKGAKPVFTCEYMVPCTWDWTMYRGWYKGGREFGSARVPWDFSVAEWSAQFLGDRVYALSEPEKKNIRWETKQYRAGNLWCRWDYPYQVGSKVFDSQHAIIAAYLTSNWRAFRTWGVSAVSPWEHHFFWTLRDGAQRRRRDLPVDWEGLQKPGFSADYIDECYERFDLAFERDDWVPTADGEAILRNNMPLLAYIAGAARAFTSKDHIFTPGQTVEKQLIVINNSRETVTCDCRWVSSFKSRAAGDSAAVGGERVTVPTGTQQRVPLRLELPADTVPGTYELSAQVQFSSGETQNDAFTLRVVPALPPPRIAATIALFDPKGETRALLERMHVACQSVGAETDLAPYDVLVVGKGALGVDTPAPAIDRLREGLNVLVFEQTAETLEKRFGFRVTEYGLRQAFVRVPDHPLAAGLDAELLRDWRGEATLLPPRLKYKLSPRLAYVPVVAWCGLEVSHVWRCGCRGNVASVLIEKPARGDFLPILEGGYSLQYSPLLEYREGKGTVVFCQLDVTGRTENDPAAERAAANLLAYIAAPPARPFAPARGVVLAGGGAGAKTHLVRAGLRVADFTGQAIASDEVLVVGAGGETVLAPHAQAVADFVKNGGRVLALGLGQQEANAFLPCKIATKKEEHIASFFAPQGAASPLAGVGPADVHNRDARELHLVSGGAEVAGNGVLAHARDANVVFCQLVPYEVSKAQGAVPSFAASAEDPWEGTRSALLTFGAVSGRGGQFGQKVAGGQPGKTYTFAVFARAVGGAAAAHLEIERSARPWDRALKAADVRIPDDKWVELHAELTVEKPFAEGWFAYVSCAQEGARLRLDGFRLYEGTYVARKLPEGTKNLLANPGFEDGTQGWSFSYDEQYNVRRTYRRSSFLLTRLLANLGAAGATPLRERFSRPAAAQERRWLEGFYLDEPEEWDDPYRFFRW